MRQLNTNIIPVQSAATVTTAAINAANLFQVSAQITATGAGAAGTLKIQVSNDYTDDTNPNFAPTNWSDLSGATVTVSGAGVLLIPKQEICYQYIRLVYTNSGTGTISVMLKGLGA